MVMMMVVVMVGSVDYDGIGDDDDVDDNDIDDDDDDGITHSENGSDVDCRYSGRGRVTGGCFLLRGSVC